MIEYKTGSIFSSEAEALVNPVNCDGIMGRGLALQFKQKFPNNFLAYLGHHERHGLRTGRMFVFDTGQILGTRYIVNFPTKKHWQEKSRIEYIESGLDALKAEVLVKYIGSVAIPAIGCGLGGLGWLQVRDLLESKLTGLNGARIMVFKPIAS